MASWEIGTADQPLQDVEENMEKKEDPSWMDFMGK